ncbi:unnamed protein product [Ixodes pacificus]
MTFLLVAKTMPAHNQAPQTVNQPSRQQHSRNRYRRDGQGLPLPFFLYVGFSCRPCLYSSTMRERYHNDLADVSEAQPFVRPLLTNKIAPEVFQQFVFCDFGFARVLINNHFSQVTTKGSPEINILCARVVSDLFSYL